jgi:hypothetical protein
MKYEIDYNFSQLPKGGATCYHIGLLARDRTKEISPKKLTDAAIILNNVANELYRRSTAREGTGEFILYQEKIKNYKYAYLAKRIK